MENSKSGVDYGLESMRILSCLSFKKGVDRANSLLGICYAQFLKKPLGIENGLTSFEIAAKKQNLSRLGRTLNNPGSVSQEIEAKGLRSFSFFYFLLNWIIYYQEISVVILLS